MVSTMVIGYLFIPTFSEYPLRAWSWAREPRDTASAPKSTHTVEPHLGRGDRFYLSR